jgi:hypothetical protein
VSQNKHVFLYSVYWKLADAEFYVAECDYGNRYINEHRITAFKKLILKLIINKERSI